MMYILKFSSVNVKLLNYCVGNIFVMYKYIQIFKLALLLCSLPYCTCFLWYTHFAHVYMSLPPTTLGANNRNNCSTILSWQQYKND